MTMMGVACFSAHRAAAAAALFPRSLGFVAHTIGTVEGHGLGASGRADDEFSTVLAFRQAIDDGSYRRIGPLSPDSSASELEEDFTFRRSASGRRAVAKAERFELLSPERLATANALAFPEGKEGSGYAKRGTGNNKLGSKL